MSNYVTEMLARYPTHLSVSQLADVLGVTTKTAYDYLQSGELPAYRVCTKWVILRDEIRDFIIQSSIYTPTEKKPTTVKPLVGA